MKSQRPLPQLQFVPINSADELHNQNAYDYLCQLDASPHNNFAKFYKELQKERDTVKKAIKTMEEWAGVDCFGQVNFTESDKERHQQYQHKLKIIRNLIDVSARVSIRCQCKSSSSSGNFGYDKDYAYGTLYTKFMHALEEYSLERRKSIHDRFVRKIKSTEISKVHYLSREVDNLFEKISRSVHPKAWKSYVEMLKDEYGITITIKDNKLHTAGENLFRDKLLFISDSYHHSFARMREEQEALNELPLGSKKRRKLAEKITKRQAALHDIRQFLHKCEIEFDKGKPKEEKNLDQSYYALIKSVYENENKSLERASSVIHDAVKDKSNREAEHAVTSCLLHPEKEDVEIGDQARYNLNIGKTPLNKTTPLQQGSWFSRFTNCFTSQTYKPQTATDLPSVIQYKYTQNGEFPKELRLSMQAELHDGIARSNPLCRDYLDALQFGAAPKADQSKPVGIDGDDSNANDTGVDDVNGDDSSTNNANIASSGIDVVYFNCLPRDRDDAEGKREVIYTHAVDTLEIQHPNIAVITLPSFKGLLDEKLLKQHEKTISASSAFARILKIMNEESKEKIQDFYLSPRVKQKIFGGKDAQAVVKNQKADMRDLLNTSFRTMLNITNPAQSNANISGAELNALYYHFIHSELTNLILLRLKPKVFHKTCKNAIDRGASASLYYNYTKSVSKMSPLSEEEFLRGMHGPATNSKCRGMNNKADTLWNAMSVYIRKLKDKFSKSDKTSWLLEWELRSKPFEHGSVAEQLAMLETEYTKNAENLKKRCSLVQGVISMWRSINHTEQDVKLLVVTKLRECARKQDANPGVVLNENEKQVLNGRIRKCYDDLIKVPENAASKR